MSRASHPKMMYLFAVLFLAVFSTRARAEKFISFTNGFSMETPEGWMRSVPRHEGVVASFLRQDSGESMNVAVRDVEPGKTTEDLQWEDLFYPKFDLIEIRKEGTSLIDGGSAKYCLYSISESPLKKQLEGNQQLMYLNYVTIRNQKLYSITFAGAEATFFSHYLSFREVVGTMKFHRPPEKKTLAEEAPEAEDLIPQ